MAGQRILYIEDNLENRMLVRRVLQAEGYAILEAADGPSGVRSAVENRPDLILVDINLPDLDGYEVTLRIRRNAELARVPIIAMTANVMHGDRERSLAAGCDGYLQKPIDIDLLPEQIAQFLSRIPS